MVKAIEVYQQLKEKGVNFDLFCDTKTKSLTFDLVCAPFKHKELESDLYSADLNVAPDGCLGLFCSDVNKVYFFPCESVDDALKIIENKLA